MDFNESITAIKKALYVITPAKFRTRVKFLLVDFVENPPILVYQMGKIGSTSIHHTLLEMNLGRKIYHAHYLSDQGMEDAKRWNRRIGRKVPASVEYFQLLGKKVQHNLGKAHYTVITGVRDPIAKEISNFFELADKIDYGIEAEDGSLDVDTVISYLLNRFCSFDVVEHRFFSTGWFDRELKGTFGLDIFDYPFNHERGYEIVRCQKLDLLMYQYEQLGNIYSDAMSKLLRLDKDDIPKLSRDNVGKVKWYADLYAEVKRKIIVPVELCRKIYDMKYVRHFYSNQTISDWIEHWSNER